MKQPRFFRTPADFGKWLEKNHDKTTELWVGFHRKDSGEPSITWPESVDEALCWGWIDGVRKKAGETAYMIRFTPRTATSTWSDVNTRRAKALIEAGRMRDSGLRAFEARKPEKAGTYSFEQKKHPELEATEEKRFRANRDAWTFFEAQPPSYRRMTLWWVVSAKREATRASRLDRLIAASAERRRL